jgi:hypothetical protein
MSLFTGNDGRHDERRMVNGVKNELILLQMSGVECL